MRRLVSLLICYENTRVTNFESRYTASAQLVPRKHRAIVGWVVGWLNILGTSLPLPRDLRSAAHAALAAPRPDRRRVVDGVRPREHDMGRGRRRKGPRLCDHARQGRRRVRGPAGVPWYPGE